MKAVFFLSFVWCLLCFAGCTAIYMQTWVAESALNLLLWLILTVNRTDKKQQSSLRELSGLRSEARSRLSVKKHWDGQRTHTYVSLLPLHASWTCRWKYRVYSLPIFLFSVSSVCMFVFTAIHDLSLFPGHSLCVFAACLNSCVTDQLQEEQRGAGQGRWS